MTGAHASGFGVGATALDAQLAAIDAVDQAAGGVLGLDTQATGGSTGPADPHGDS